MEHKGRFTEFSADEIVLAGPEEAMQRTRESFHKHALKVGVLGEMDCVLPKDVNLEDVANGIVAAAHFTFSGAFSDRLSEYTAEFTEQDCGLYLALIAAEALKIPWDKSLRFINCSFEAVMFFRCSFVNSLGPSVFLNKEGNWQNKITK